MAEGRIPSSHLARPVPEAEHSLGHGIRAERLRQELTLLQLAERCGLSPSALSQIERGITDPSISSLRRISAALGVPFFQFLVEAEPQTMIVRRASRRTISFPGRSLLYQLVSPHVRGPFEVLAVELSPGSATGEELLGHDSEECLLVLRGAIAVEVGAQVYALAEGDSIYLPRNLPHRSVNRGTETAELLSVISPANF